MTPDAASALLKAYRRTHYQVMIGSQAIVLHIDRYDADIDRRLCNYCDIKSCWSIVTPCNPHSQPLTGTDNADRLRALHVELARSGLRWVTSVNHDPEGEWPDEPGVLLCDPPAGSAEALGRKYGQNAIVSGEPGVAPRLVCL